MMVTIAGSIAGIIYASYTDNRASLWQDYLQRLAAANSNRETQLNFRQL